jgi:hypothetical protein
LKAADRRGAGEAVSEERKALELNRSAEAIVLEMGRRVWEMEREMAGVGRRKVLLARREKVAGALDSSQGSAPKAWANVIRSCSAATQRQCESAAGTPCWAKWMEMDAIIIIIIIIMTALPRCFPGAPRHHGFGLLPT